MVTLTLQGSDFTPQTVVSLVHGGTATPITAASVDDPSGGTLYATFNLTGAIAGSYNLQVSNGGAAVAAPGSFTVETGSPGQVVFSVSVPALMSYLRQEYVTVNYTNIGDTDAPAPLVALVGNDVAIRLPDDTSFDPSGAVQFLALDPNGPAGILPPGYSGSISIPFYTTNDVGHTPINFNLYQAEEYEIPSTPSVGQPAVAPAVFPDAPPAGATPIPLDWASQESALQPAGVSAAAWNTVWTNFVAEAGSTAPQFLSVLDNLATYLGDIGSLDQPEVDFSRLYDMLIAQAAGDLAGPTMASTVDTVSPAPDLSLGIDRTFAQSIEGRDARGLFGLGWSTSWDISAATDSAGDVSLITPYSDESFTLQSDGTYQAEPGNLDTLTKSGGDYLVQMPDGGVNAFNVTTGALAYEQDANGNKVTAGYNGVGELTSLTHSDGQVLTLSYNGQGFVSEVTDPEGRVYQYAYNSAGNLLSVSGPQGTTTYGYDSAGAAANALASVTVPGGLAQTFAYNAEGWLTGDSIGGAYAETLSYVSPFGVTATDADGNTSTILFNDSLQPAREIDGLGNVTSLYYDDFGNLARVVSPKGETTTYQYDAAGDLTSATDPLGHTVSYTYNAASGEMTGVTDANGNTTSYAYNAQGNPLSITYPDGSAEQFQYNPEGDMTETIDQEGQPTAITYNAFGQPTVETFADGTSLTNTYDAHGNLVTATDASGTTTLTYNTADELTEVAYPNGQFLKFTYDAGGDRTQSVDQDGFTVNYQYDSVGRLAGLTSGSGASIVTYTYDPAGLLTHEVMGNGTSTIYTYNPAGELTNEVNNAPGGAVNSQFAYTYDADGDVLTATTAAGTTTYGYDADDELISVSAPGGQLIAYTYDANGNRTSETVDGVTTTSTFNNMNEVTQAGATAYAYNADGDRISSSTGGSTTTYTYNAQNQMTGDSDRRARTRTSTTRSGACRARRRTGSRRPTSSIRRASEPSSGNTARAVWWRTTPTASGW